MSARPNRLRSRTGSRNDKPRFRFRGPSIRFSRPHSAAAAIAMTASHQVHDCTFRKPTPAPMTSKRSASRCAVLIDRTDLSRSLLLNKPTNRERHTGGVRIRPGSFDEQALSTWVTHLAGVSDEAVAAAARGWRRPCRRPGPTQALRRLTHSQYNNTVRDLLGDYSRPARAISARRLRGRLQEPAAHSGHAAAAGRGLQHRGREAGAECVPRRRRQRADSVQAASRRRDAKCRDQFVRSFGARAFRRPLTDDGVPPLRARSSPTQARSAGKFLEGARVVVEAMLQSPKFLFHVMALDAKARRADARFRDYAIASRLSYLLWDTHAGPGAARRRGERRAANARRAASAQRADDARQSAASQAADEFFNQWLRFDRVLERGQGAPPLSRVHAGAGRDDGRRRRACSWATWSGTTAISWRRSPPITAS